MSHPIVKFLILLTLLLAVPMVPFLLLGGYLEPWVDSSLSSRGVSFSPLVAGCWIVGLLSVDILLPIPSSVVCTFAGKELGGWWGTLVSWAGLNASAAIGYEIGTRFGLPLVRKFSDQDALDQIEKFDNRSSVVCLIICRGLPVVAEASVMFMGIKSLSRKLFWPPILLANLGLAAAYSALGYFSHEAAWFPVALAVSLSIPVVFLMYWYQRKTANKI